MNLVYDRFDGEEPIINLKDVYSNRRLSDSRNLIKHYIDDTSFKSKFSQRNCGFNEVSENPNKKYYYIINFGSEHLVDIFYPDNVTFTNPFNKNVMDHLYGCKNFNVIFLTEHEPDNEMGFECLDKFIKDNNINGQQIYLITNNSKLKDYKEKHNSQINIHTLRFIPHSSTKVLYKIGGCEYKPIKEGKFFMMFNKSPKQHRYALLCLLKKYNLLDEFNWSLVPGYNCQPRDSYYDGIFDQNERDDLKEEIKYFYDLKIKRSDLEEDKGWFNEFSDVNTSEFPIWIHTPEYPKNHEDTYVNVITESMFQDKWNNIHISEKSFKPFFYYQFPMILSTQGHIKKIKELYGLDFFDDIINHSYDNEPNQKNRLNMFVNELKRLSTIKNELIEFYKNNKERFESNKQKVLNLLTIVDEDYLFFENLCK